MAAIMIPDPAPVSRPSFAIPSEKMPGNMIELHRPTRRMLHIETGPVPSIEMVTSVAALCDIRLRNWIKQNRIELVNFHDALYATDEYQNHLRIIGSDLYIRRNDCQGCQLPATRNLMARSASSQKAEKPQSTKRPS